MRIPRQISLRTLLLVVLFLGVLLGYLGAWQRCFQREAGIAAAIVQSGGGVHYESVFKRRDPDRTLARELPGDPEVGWSQIDIIGFADADGDLNQSQPARWKELSELKEFLCLHKAFRDEHLLHLCECRQLRTVWLMSPQISGRGLAKIGELANLTKLELEGTTLTGDDIAQMTAGPKLSHLDIQVDAAGLRALLRAPWVRSLEKLNLTIERTPDSGAVPLEPLQTVPRLENLKALTIDCALSAEELEFLSAGIPQVEFLSVRAKLTPQACANLARSGKLRELQLYNCDLHDADLLPLAQLKSLKTLSLTSNPLTSAGLHPLQDLPLDTLNLNDTDVDNSLIDFLRANRSLTTVRVDGAKLTTVGQRAIGRLRPTLQIHTSACWAVIGIENNLAEQEEQRCHCPECG